MRCLCLVGVEAGKGLRQERAQVLKRTGVGLENEDMLQVLGAFSVLACCLLLLF